MLRHEDIDRNTKEDCDKYPEIYNDMLSPACSECWCLQAPLFKKISQGLAFTTRNTLTSSKWNYVTFALLFFSCHEGVLSATVASTTATTPATNETEIVGSLSTFVEDESADVPKAVVTVAGLLVFFVAAFAIAKLIDYCHDRRAIRDDASDISDYTKELLKTQMMMMAFSRGRSKGKKLKPKEAALKFGKMWRAKVARNKVRLMKIKSKAISEAKAKGQDPDVEAAKAEEEFEKKRIKNQINAYKNISKDGKNDSDLKAKDNKPDSNKVAPSNNKKPPLPPTHGKEADAKDPASVFTISETKVSDEKTKPLEPPKNTKVPLTRSSSRPISAGLKSRPGSAKSVKSRRLFGSLLKK